MVGFTINYRKFIFDRPKILELEEYNDWKAFLNKNPDYKFKSKFFKTKPLRGNFLIILIGSIALVLLNWVTDGGKDGISRYLMAGIGFGVFFQIVILLIELGYIYHYLDEEKKYYSQRVQAIKDSFDYEDLLNTFYSNFPKQKLRK